MHKTLLVIDMQNDFITMALGTKEAVAILPTVKQKIATYKNCGDTIIYTRDTHGKDYLQTSEGKNLPVMHCIKGTKGWEIADGLYVPNSRIIDKSTFGWPHWDSIELESVELIGLCTDICVVSNALMIKAQHPGAEITVDASCCAGVTPQTHLAALETMKMCQIQVLD